MPTKLEQLLADIDPEKTYDQTFARADDAINSFAEGNEKMGMLMGMKRFTKVDGVNVIAARRKMIRISNRKYM